MFQRSDKFYLISVMHKTSEVFCHFFQLGIFPTTAGPYNLNCVIFQGLSDRFSFEGEGGGNFCRNIWVQFSVHIQGWGQMGDFEKCSHWRQNQLWHFQRCKQFFEVPKQCNTSEFVSSCNLKLKINIAISNSSPLIMYIMFIYFVICQQKIYTEKRSHPKFSEVLVFWPKLILYIIACVTVIHSNIIFYSFFSPLFRVNFHCFG